MSEMLDESHQKIYTLFKLVAHKNRHDLVVLDGDEAKIRASITLEEDHDDVLDVIDEAFDEHILPEVSHDSFKFLQALAFCSELKININLEQEPDYDPYDAELIVSDAIKGVEYSPPQLNKWSFN